MGIGLRTLSLLLSDTDFVLLAEACEGPAGLAETVGETTGVVATGVGGAGGRYGDNRGLSLVRCDIATGEDPYRLVAVGAALDGVELALGAQLSRRNNFGSSWLWHGGRFGWSGVRRLFCCLRGGAMSSTLSISAFLALLALLGLFFFAALVDPLLPRLISALHGGQEIGVVLRPALLAVVFVG